MAASTTKKHRSAHKLASIALSTTALFAPGVAYADCSLSGTAINCSGTSAAYTYPGTARVDVTVTSSTTQSTPLVVSTNGSTLTNAGTISNTAIQYGVNFAGTGVTITNNGTISSTSAYTGAGAITVGAGSTVINNSVMTAYAGTPVVNFTSSGTFINNTAATAAVSGNVVYGTNTGTDRGYFYNYNTTYGFTGTVTGSGNMTLYNSGILTGNVIQTAKALTNAVSFTNDNGGTFTGVFVSGDQTSFTNKAGATAYLYSGSAIGTLGLYDSLLTNSGTLAAGTTSAPSILSVYGNFVQTSTGILSVAIAPAGSSTTTAGSTYSQIYTSGTATLGGTLNLNVAAGFYPTGKLYSVIDAKGGITGDFSSITGNDLLFVSFDKVGVVTVSGTEQAYQMIANHKSYATVFGNAGVGANQLKIAKGLDKLLVTATADSGSDSATFLGELDILNINQATHVLNQLSPEGYLAYAQALNDQANMFTRQVGMRMNDQNSDHPEDGWWLSMIGQGSFGSVYGTSRTRDHLMGFSGGYDFSGPGYVYGVAAHMSWDSLVNGNGSLTGTNRDYALAAYGAKNFGPLRFSGQAAYNAGHMSTTKGITLGSYARSATGSAGESLLKLSGQVGFDLRVKSVTIEPFVGVDFAKGKISGFTESDAGAADLTVSGINADRTDLLAGVSLTRNTGMFRPYFRAAYRSRQSGGDTTVSAYFNGDTTTAFTVTGLSKAKNEVDVNSGMNFVFDDAGALFVGYQGTYRSNYKSHGINFGIRLEF